MLIFCHPQPSIADMLQSDLDALFAMADKVCLTVNPVRVDGYSDSGLPVNDDERAAETAKPDLFDDHGDGYVVPHWKDAVAPGEHPALRYANPSAGPAEKAADYRACVNVFHHHRCTPGFCCVNGGKCKRRFPRALVDDTRLDSRRDSRKRKRVAVVTRRNNRFINPHNPHFAITWRGNHDVQLIVDPHGAANYATSCAMYSSKPDMPDDHALNDALTKAFTNLDPDAPGNRLLNTAGFAVLGVTPVSAQHAAYYNMHFDFVSNTRTVRLVNARVPSDRTVMLLSREELNDRRDDDAAVTDASVMPSPQIAYAARDVSKETMTFREFAEHYDEIHGRDDAVNARNDRLQCGDHLFRRLFRRRTRAHVLRVTPHRAFNLTDEQFAYACVLLDTPWRKEDELLEGGSAVSAMRAR